VGEEGSRENCSFTTIPRSFAIRVALTMVTLVSPGLLIGVVRPLMRAANKGFVLLMLATSPW